MEIPFVDLKAQYKDIKNEIDHSIQNVIDETAFIKGKYVQQFEQDYSSSYQVKHVISCANGTDALFIALKALEIGPGDEVITTAHSWISTSETITLAGAKVVFVDIEEDLFTIDVNQIEGKINKNTKAIIPVHIYGHPVNMSSIMNIAQKYNLKVVEDCAQAHFAEWKGQRVGTFGDVGTFSFFPGKNLGAYGDAGCAITNDESLAKKMRRFANHGALIKHEHSIEGINSRLDGLQAAILSVKLNHIKKWTDQRIKNHSIYDVLLQGIPNLIIPKTQSEAKHVFHLYVIRVENREDLQSYLKSNGVSTAIHYPVPLPFMDAYKYLNNKHTDFPNMLEMKDNILSIPMYPELKEEQIEYVARHLKNFYNS